MAKSKDSSRRARGSSRGRKCKGCQHRKRKLIGAWRSVSRAVASVGASVADTARSFGSTSSMRRLRRTFGRKPPKIRERACPEGVCGAGGWAGKYDPKRHEVSIRREKRMPRKLRKALRAHEIAHGMVCDRTSPGGLKKCTYRGQHDARFYRTAAKVHRVMGTDPHAAMELERRSGYTPPRGYAQALRRRRTRRGRVGRVRASR